MKVKPIKYNNFQDQEIKIVSNMSWLYTFSKNLN
jgi:hypothetical protein